jgi:hypothetical protein
MIRTHIVGYVVSIRSERLLCRQVKVNLAYRWVCGLSVEDWVPDHSTFCTAKILNLLSLRRIANSWLFATLRNCLSLDATTSLTGFAMRPQHLIAWHRGQGVHCATTSKPCTFAASPPNANAYATTSQGQASRRVSSTAWLYRSRERRPGGEALAILTGSASFAVGSVTGLPFGAASPALWDNCLVRYLVTKSQAGLLRNKADAPPTKETCP